LGQATDLLLLFPVIPLFPWVEIDGGVAKASYMQKDVARSGKIMGMGNFKQPSVFPIQSYKVPPLIKYSV